MPIPLAYNLRSVSARWTSAVVAVLGIAVGVFVAMLSLARGFKATLVASGSPDNALVRRADSNSEIIGSLELDQVRVVENSPFIAGGKDGPLASPEVVVIAVFPLKATGSDAMVQVRGVSAKALEVRGKIRMTAGRFLRPGLNELVVGSNAVRSYEGFALGDTARFGGATWTVVGVFDAGGSSFDSEIWTDAALLNQLYQRPTNIFQSVTVRLASADAFASFRDAMTSDPRLNVRVEREIEFYASQSTMLTTLIVVFGSIVGAVMGIGAVFGALNTMYSAVSERSREIATIRALGFGEMSVVVSFLFEALVIALIGGAIGCAAVVPLNHYTVGALNFQSFSHLDFAFRVTPDLLLAGIAFALVMGIAGGVPPAVHAARSAIAPTLRGL